jgi:drug/metabolite transporter (DMT)-like permease
MGEFLALLSLTLFASNIIITKLGTSRLNLSLGYFVSTSVNIIFAICLFAVNYMIKSGIEPFHLKAFILFLLSGIFATFFGRWLFFETIERLGPAKASTFMTSNPLFTLLISWVILGESLSIPQGLGTAAVLMGLFFVSYVKIRPESPKVSNSADMEIAATVHTGGRWANVGRTLFNPTLFIALLSSLSYAIGNILRGTAVQQWNEPILGALLGAALGLTLHMTFSIKISTIGDQIRNADRRGLLLYMLSGALTVSAQILYIASMKYLPVSIATLLTMSTPILVIPISYFIMKNQEGITWRTVFGAILVLGGINVIILL